MLHDTALTTLTLVGTGVNIDRHTVTRQAAADLAAIERIASSEDVDDTPMSLDAILVAEIARYAHTLTVDAALPACHVPTRVALAFAGAVREALENTVRYSGIGKATVMSCMRAGQIRVEAHDSGIGFDPAAARPQQYGIRESIIERMAAVGGRATLHIPRRRHSMDARVARRHRSVAAAD
jgi:signal transduction histidine kinase